MFRKTFEAPGTFDAWHAARKWLEESGYSCSDTSAMHPVAVLKGDWLIAKWKNLTHKEIEALDGRVYGDFRNGPVTVELKIAPAA